MDTPSNGEDAENQDPWEMRTCSDEAVSARDIQLNHTLDAIVNVKVTRNALGRLYMDCLSHLVA